MKAQVLYGINDMRYEDIEEPQLKDGWVIVKVMAAGICGSDIPRIYKTGAHVHPIVIGHEFSGKVVKTYIIYTNTI
jgi:L-iditol 2-dehydrogenase